jgi:large subunit ribosomal protein L18
MSGHHNKRERRQLRKLRIRRKISGSDVRPRLAVYRSARHIYAQLVDDLSGSTLVSASSREPATTAAAVDKDQGKGKVGLSYVVGKVLGERAKEKGISIVSFDRGGYLYHGRVKALADGARAAGLEF